MPTVKEVFEKHRSQFGSVPPRNKEFCCPYCLGAVSGHTQCYGCLQYFVRGPVPGALVDRVVPMTVALTPSAWYSALLTFKTWRAEHQPMLAALAWTYIEAHRPRIESILGADFVIAIVPSTRPGVGFSNSPLANTLRLVPPMRNLLKNLIEHDGETQIKHNGFAPEAFRPTPTPVSGRGVLLIEDTWVSGGTALSAASRLVDLGAEVLILPLARRASLGASEQAYIDYASVTPYDPTVWPR